MTLELVSNIVLLIFFLFCFFDVSRLSNLPDSDPMGGAMWPQIVLAILIIMLGINIYQIIKKNQANPGKLEKLDMTVIKGFFFSKLFVGILFIFGAAYLLDLVGFLPTTFLFVTCYAYLLGKRNIPKILLTAFLVAIIFFFFFSMVLSIMLPRGYGPFREFALFLENIL